MESRLAMDGKFCSENWPNRPNGLTEMQNPSKNTCNNAIFLGRSGILESVDANPDSCPDAPFDVSKYTKKGKERQRVLVRKIKATVDSAELPSEPSVTPVTSTEVFFPKRRRG